MAQAYIVTALRTPVGKAPRGILSSERPDNLLAHVLHSLCCATPSLPPDAIEDVIIGCAMPEAEQGMNVARMSLLLAGLPDSVPGVTVNRFCASGLEAVAIASQRIAAGSADVIIAGGVESMSAIPMGGYSLRYNPQVFENNQFLGMAYGMGLTAEEVAKRFNISRDRQDQFAYQSHMRALAAQANNQFSAEIAPYTLTRTTVDEAHFATSTMTQTATMDEGPRKDTSLEKLTALKSVFAAKGSVTAGNSSQMSDGAAAILLASERAIARYQLTPIARFVSYAVAGVAPEIMGIGPIKAVPRVLAQAQLQLSDIDWIELNEAFAAQSLAVIQQLDLDSAKVNPLGGAIALGHPLGATGAIRTATLVHGLRQQKNRYGIVTMCIGTGMGAAGLFENLA